MKYRLTPFHFLTLYFFGKGIHDFYVLSKYKYDTQLGELVPYLYFGLGFITLFIDLLIQVLIIGLLWVWLKYFPTVHNQ